MKRVLIVNTATTSKSNGISNIMLAYAKSVSDEYEADLFIAGRLVDEDLKDIRKAFRKVFRFKRSRVRNPLRYMRALTALIKNNGYDIIHVHGNSATMYLEIHTAKKCGIEVRVCHCHSTSCKYKAAHYLLKKPLNKELTAALACSQAAGRWLFTWDFNVLKNGIESENFLFDAVQRAAYRKELGLENCFVIGHVGYLSDEKNQMFLLSLAKELTAQAKDIRLLLIGDGALRDQLEAEIRNSGLQNNVLMLGRRNDAAKLYSCMDLFVFPSKFEGFGLALIEAQTCGLRCISSDRVPEDTGISSEISYLPLENRDEWIKEILDAYRNRGSSDRAAESRLSRQRLIAEGYDVKCSREFLADVYEGKY